jgi:hypothetical protein
LIYVLIVIFMAGDDITTITKHAKNMNECHAEVVRRIETKQDPVLSKYACVSIHKSGPAT